MGTDSSYRSEIEPSKGYEKVKAVAPIAASARHIVSTYIEQIAVVVITLRFASGMSGGSQNISRRNGTAQSTQHRARHEQEMAPLEELLTSEQVVCYLLENLRPLVRKTDRVYLLEHTIYFLLPGADQQGGQIVQSRLWEALLWHTNKITHSQKRSPLSSCTITIGHRAYPAPCIDIDELINTAGETVLRLDQHPKRRKAKDGVVADNKDHKAPHVSQHISFSEEENVDEELPVLARKLGIPYLTLLPSKLPFEVQQLVNPKLAHELQCYPLGRERNMLTVAMLNPQDRSALDRLHQETGLNIFPVLTHPQALQAALERLVC